MSVPAESAAAAAMSGRLVRRVWRAPQADRTAVIVPPWPDAASLATVTAGRFADLAGEVQGKSWVDLRTWTRSSCLAAARAYLGELGFVVEAADQSGPVIVGGHQPELFHPGVWAKNFAAHALAQRTGGIGVQLIVDNDTLPRSALRVPAGDARQPHGHWLPFDDPQPAQPWEEVRVANRSRFASFADRVREALQPWGVQPVLPDVWPAARRAAEQGLRLADCLTAARVAAERAWQAGNLELPLSWLCRQPPFLWFASAILARADEFARQHNAVLGEYRRLNRVRSRSHPVPELASEAGWTEAPFWIWRSGDTRRERLFVQRSGSEIRLRGQGEVLLQVPLTAERSAESAVEALSTLATNGWRLRTRALTTTLFARLCLADLFVHGLGGAKYDEMTDALMTRFFGVEPPPFLTVTATVRLPLGPTELVSADDLGRVRHALWDLAHNPQRHLGENLPEGARELVAERQQLVQQLLAESDRRRRSVRRQAYRRVHAINAELAAMLDSRRRELADELSRLEQGRAANRLLLSREYSWALFPAELLRGFYAELFEASAAG
uniref:Flagellar protein FliT n=1 Tax=Schlesneria paludicola TaxID=360056 RepID=A0A7C2NYW4_9PLAN